MSKEADAKQKFKQAIEACELLKDSKKRVAYDQLGKIDAVVEEFTPPPN